MVQSCMRRLLIESYRESVIDWSAFAPAKDFNLLLITRVL